MLATERHFLWQLTALCMGLALPAVLLGNSLMYTLLLAAAICGLLATKGASLRSSLKLLMTSKVTLLVIVGLVWLIITAILGVTPEYSLHKAGQVWLVALVGAILFLALREMPGRYTTVMQLALVCGLVFMMCLSLLDAFTGSYRLSAALHGSDKALTPHRQNFYSILFAIGVPFLWAHYIRRMSEGVPLIKMTAPIILPLSVFIIILGGGRAGWLALGVALVVFLSIGIRRYKLPMRSKQWLVLVGSILAGGLAYGFTRGWGQLLARLELQAFEHELMGGSGRTDIWQSVVNLIPWDLTNPQFWLGIGPNAFRSFPEGSSLHPHNAALQLLLETGAIGLILGLGFGLILLLYFWRWAQGNLFGLAALASLWAFTTAAMFSKSIFDVEWLAIFTVMCLLSWRLGWSRGQQQERNVLNASSFIKTPHV